LGGKSGMSRQINYKQYWRCVRPIFLKTFEDKKLRFKFCFGTLFLIIGVLATIIQRLALARLFLKKPKICIFDESTSSLDKNTELKIQKNIETFLPGMTKIIITHRPVIVENADQIITLGNGRFFPKPQLNQPIKQRR
jgi:hypothetical protein